MGKTIEDALTMSAKPLPCPFCGGEAAAMHMGFEGINLPQLSTVWGVFCLSDLDSEYQHGHYIDNYPTEDAAVQAWNRIAR